MSWEISYADTALKELKKLDKGVSKEILDYMDEKVAPLDDARSVGKALKGPLVSFWRYRVGDKRVICHIDDGKVTVLVLRVGHRSKVYKDEKKIAAKAAEDIAAFEDEHDDDDDQ